MIPRSARIWAPTPYSRLSVGIAGIDRRIDLAGGVERVGDAQPPALVAAEVDEHAGALLHDAAHRRVQRAPALAVARAEHVAGEALAVHAHHRLVSRRDVAANERDVPAVVEHRLERDDLEVAPRGRQRRRADAAHQLLGPAAVADQVGDRDHQQPVAGAELLQLRAPGHVVLGLADDLAQHAGGSAAGHAGQVDGRLGVARPLQHAAVPRLEREDVARAQQVVGPRRRVDERLDRRRPIGRRDARRGAVPVVDRDEERRALALGVLLDHRLERQLAGSLRRDGRADDAGRVLQEEGDLLRRGELGGHDQVALVLAVLVVDDDHDLAATDGRHGILDAGQPRHLTDPSRRAGARRTWR